MTLDEARAHIGDAVIYHPYAPELDPAEEGVITSVNDRYVFVRYGGDKGSKATAAERLTLLAASLPDLACPDCGRESCTGEDCYWPDEAGVPRPDRAPPPSAGGGDR